MKMTFEVCFVITNGVSRKKYLWISRRKSGFYVALAMPGNFHFSYHEDGNFHTKLGKTIKVPSEALKQNLSDFKGVEIITGGGGIINNESLIDYQLPDFNDEIVDSIVYIDNRIMSVLTFQVWLVEPYKINEIPIPPDKPVQVHVFSRTTPWLVVLLYDVIFEQQ